MKFDVIRNIDLVDEKSWNDTLFITIDVDWAADEVIAYTADLLEKADKPATWFITHDTPLLARLRENPKFALAIHPNFNPLLEGSDSHGKNAREVLERMMKLVPEATSVRSHSMTQSSPLLSLFSELGLSHDANHFIPFQSNGALKPWRFWDGKLTRVPYFWEDDVACLYNTGFDLKPLVMGDGVKVFDFHPIHVFLNTENMQRYEDTRASHQHAGVLSEHRNRDAEGACTALTQLLEM